MDEADVIRDILDRLDKLTQHIIDIKGTMYRHADFKVDAARLYDHIGTVQTQMLVVVKEAVTALESQVKSADAKYEKLDSNLNLLWTAENALKSEVGALRAEVNRPKIPGWLIGLLSAIGSGVVTTAILHAVHLG